MALLGVTTEAVTQVVTEIATPQKLSLVRKYSTELLCALLILLLYGTIMAYLGKSSAFQEFLMTTHSKDVEVISNNTHVVEENTKAINRNNELLQRRIEQTDNQNHINLTP